jgi:hypothetical protein
MDSVYLLSMSNKNHDRMTHTTSERGLVGFGLPFGLPPSYENSAHIALVECLRISPVI